LYDFNGLVLQALTQKEIQAIITVELVRLKYDKVLVDNNCRKVVNLPMSTTARFLRINKIR